MSTRVIQARLTTSPAQITIITGPPAAGKTALARSAFPQLKYYNLDNPEQRALLQDADAGDWAWRVGPAILDQVHKDPSVLAKVQAAYQAGALQQTVLLGSSEAWLTEAFCRQQDGAVQVVNVWPLMASELQALMPAARHQGQFQPPLLDTLLRQPGQADDLLGKRNFALDPSQTRQARRAIAHLLAWGGLPALVQRDDDARTAWLERFVADFPERGAGAFPRVSDMVPFRRFYRLCAAYSGERLSYAGLAREGHINQRTARRYVTYLEQLHQIILLPAWPENLTSTAVKSPRLFCLDLGLWRALLDWGERGGARLWETLVVSEIFKWVHSSGYDTPLFYYRTEAGLEVSLLLSTPEGIWCLQAVDEETPKPGDWRSLREVGAALGRRWRGGLVIYPGRTVNRLASNIWALPAEQLLALPRYRAPVSRMSTGLFVR